MAHLDIPKKNKPLVKSPARERGCRRKRGRTSCLPHRRPIPREQTTARQCSARTVPRAFGKSVVFWPFRYGDPIRSLHWWHWRQTCSLRHFRHAIFASIVINPARVHQQFYRKSCSVRNSPTKIVSFYEKSPDENSPRTD